MAIESVKQKVRVIRPLSGVFLEYQPEIGKIYEADYRRAKRRTEGQTNAPVCVIKILDKHICLRSGEYEIVEDELWR
jgi:hypothetical protein